MIENLILIDQSIKQNNILIDALKSNCAYYLYDPTTTSQQITDYLSQNNITQISRICLIFHDKGPSSYVYQFINNKPLFTDNDIITNTQIPKSTNYLFMINLINTLSPSHVDYLACNLYQYDKLKTYFESLIANCNNQNLKVGASMNMTGNMIYGGDWILESTGEDIQNIYFTSNINFWTYLLFNLSFNMYYNNYEALDTDTHGNYIDTNGEIVLDKINDGLYNIQVWGNSPTESPGYGYGGNNSNIPLNTTIRKVYSNQFSFNALADDGAVYVWGTMPYSGAIYGQYDPDTDSTPVIGYVTDSSGNKITNFEKVYSNTYTYAGAMTDGKIYYWGTGTNTYIKDPSDNYVLNPTKIYSAGNAFAALLSDNTVFTWGDYTDNDYLKDNSGNIVTGVTKIFSNNDAFAALLSNETVFVWGSSTAGGASTYNDESTRGYIKDNSDNIITGVTKIYASYRAFAALNASGNIFIWGASSYAGTQVYNDYTTRGYIKDNSGNIISGFTKVYSTFAAFAGLLDNGQVFIWGSESYGGTYDYNDNTKATSGYVKDASDNILSGITKIYNNEGAFAALNASGSIFSWGNPFSGGGRTYIKDNSDNIIINVTKIYSNDRAFAAYSSDKSVFVWGLTTSGGTYVVGDASTRGYIKDASDNIITNVKFIYSNEISFSLVDYSGNVLAWGNQSNGGDLTITPNPLPDTYSKYIFATQFAYCEMTQYAGDENPPDLLYNQTWIYYTGNNSNFKLNIPFDVVREAVYKHHYIYAIVNNNIIIG